MRSQMEKRVLQKEKEEQEFKLRDLARKAREEREIITENAYKDEDVDQRDMLRKERHRDRERERRIARAGAGKRYLFLFLLILDHYWKKKRIVILVKRLLWECPILKFHTKLCLINVFLTKHRYFIIIYIFYKLYIL